ncbi:heme peroxidase [Mycena capillaripes]|nr:heme peroxidase [Mycena capillaripes]
MQDGHGLETQALPPPPQAQRPFGNFPRSSTMPSKRAGSLRFTLRHVTTADAIALLAVLAVENCGGPEIAFRGGRIDAVEPNAPGVPQPQQNIDSHIASFARQGFTKTEMIGLVACGCVIRLALINRTDHFESTMNITLQFAGTSTSSGGKYNAAWYSFNATFTQRAAGFRAACLYIWYPGFLYGFLI